MLIEQIEPHGRLVLRQRFAGAGTACKVGRDLDCDIVLSDEHAAPQHALLTLLEDGRVSVRDLGTKNGTRLEGQRIPPGVEAIVEQCELIVGRTRLRVRTRHTAVGPERLFRRDFVRRYRTPLAAAGVAACMAYGAFWQWLDAPASVFRSVMVGMLAPLGAIALWAGVWALISKLNHGMWEVRVHAAVVSIAAAMVAWGLWVADVVAFATQWSVLTQIALVLAGAVALFALYLHLREATYYDRRVSLALAASFTLLFGATAWIIAIRGDDRDVNRVQLGPDVRLGADRVVPNRDVADYLAEVDELRRDAGRERQKSLLDAPLAEAED